MKLGKRVWMAILGLALGLTPGLQAAEVVIIDDPLHHGTNGVREGGAWTTGGGWQAQAGQDVRITWDLGSRYCAGRFEVDVRNFLPCEQPNNEKCHIMTLYESANQGSRQGRRPRSRRPRRPGDNRRPGWLRPPQSNQAPIVTLALANRRLAAEAQGIPWQDAEAVKATFPDSHRVS